MGQNGHEFMKDDDGYDDDDDDDRLCLENLLVNNFDGINLKTFQFTKGECYIVFCARYLRSFKTSLFAKLNK